MKALIVEDSRLARVELKNLLKEHPEVEIVGEAANAQLAREFLEKEVVDLLFLDINMPGKNGFEFLEGLDEVPLVIFTTAYDEYAIKAFEINALDYLLKPIDTSRLQAALERVAEELVGQQTTPVLNTLQQNSRIFVKDGEDCWLVEIRDIHRMESIGNYTRIHFKNQQALVHKSLTKIEERLSTDQFFRANRQELIQLRFIDDIVPWFSGNLKVKMLDGVEVEISRRQASKFKKLLSL